jgi:hypothetical protein
MARKPKFGTPEGAELWAVGKGAPRRGSGIPINSLTRGLARNWIVASGVPSPTAYALSVKQLSEAWHDLTGAAVARLKGAPAPLPSPPYPVKETDDMPTDHAAKIKALMDILKPDTPALDEAQVLDIVARNLNNTISAATERATEQARVVLSDVVEEARAIVSGAPRVLRIDIKGSIRELPAAPRHHSFDILLTMTVCGRERVGLPVMLAGPAGGGKTTGAEHVAQALGLPFYSNGAS